MPVLYVVAAGFGLLAMWAQYARGYLIAAACVAIGGLQHVRDDRERRRDAAPPVRDPLDDRLGD